MTTPQDPHTDHARPAPTAAATPPLGQQRWDELTSGDPESFPEALAFVTMLAGALDGLGRGVSELEGRLHHVLRDPVPEPTADVANYPVEISTELTRRLRDLYEHVVRIDRAVGGIHGRLGV